MKIKLINYAYKDYPVGEIVDFGEEKNKSLVSLQRAVWYDPDELERMRRESIKKQKKQSEDKPETNTEEQAIIVEKKKKIKSSGTRLIGNKIRDEVQKKQAEKKEGFWDKLK